MKYAIHNADFVLWAKEEQARIEAGAPKYHAVLCDPPYGIAFMGKAWDDLGGPAAFQAQCKVWGESLLPLLQPGALVFMFAGTRMWHRLAAGMEDAGFHLWDTLMWLHGQGFPKAQDISKLIDKSGGEQSAPWAGHKTPQLKPAWEPVLCFRSPADQTYAELATQYGSGALNIEAGRISIDPSEQEKTTRILRAQDCSQQFYGQSGRHADTTDLKAEGRYPANIALDETTAPMLDEQSGELSSGSGPRKLGGQLTKNCYGTFGASAKEWDGDSGGASRFFYVAKADPAEREAGLHGAFASQTVRTGCEDNGQQLTRFTKTTENPHPTVKPLSLNKWLAGMLLPAKSVSPRRLLVPFAGVASEMIGGVLAGWDEIVGVELTAEYVPIGRTRLEHWAKGALVKIERQPGQPIPKGDRGLFS